MISQTQPTIHFERIRCDQLVSGDIVIIDGYVDHVVSVRTYNMSEPVGTSGKWPVLHLLLGSQGIARFGHETIQRATL